VDDSLDWRHRGVYVAKHGLTPALADEAWDDPGRLVIDPDPASESGRTIRVIGWSATMRRLVTVIALPDGPATWGVNAWPSNDVDTSRYRKDKDQ
jgi:hypothetical protein